MDLVNELVKTLITVSTITAGIVWLAKGFITHSFNRDLERFKTHLKSEADSQIEQFKAELGRQHLERQIVFGKLQERRAEVIAKLYNLVWPLAYEGQRVPHLAYRGDTEKVDLVAKQWADLVAHLKGNRIYFSEKLCELLDDFISSVGYTLQAGTTMQMRGMQADDHQQDPKSEEHEKSLWDDLQRNNEQTFQLLRAIEAEFRTLVGTTTP